MKDKFDIFFSNFEKSKRNLKFLSPVLRGEREIWKKVLHFREEKEKGVVFSQVSRGEREFLLKISYFEKRKRNLKKIPQFWEEKEKFGKEFSTFEKRKRNWYYFLKFREEKENSDQAFWKVSLSPKLCQSYCDSQSFRESESFTLISFSVRIVISAAMLSINHGNYFYMSEYTHVQRQPYY